MSDMSMGQHLLADILPPDIYRPGQIIDKKSVNSLFSDLATKYPDEYKDISNRATILGRDAGQMTNGGSFSIRHLATPKGAQQRRELLKQQVATILQTLPESEHDKAIVEVLSKLQATDKDDTVSEIAAENNPLALILKGAGRGNPAAIARLVSSDLMYADSSGRPIPIPIVNSYSRGLTPAEYVASTFGVRSGLVTAKTGIGMGGYSAKLLLGAAHRMIVTGEDAPEALAALSANRGLPVDTDDDDNVGALLARDTGPYKRNTRLDPKILAHLKKLGNDQILVRSPLTSVDPDGGVYARDVGYREKDQLPGIGEAVGITAAGALCLHVDTPVRMADGTVKRIADIVAGDSVLGCSVDGVVRPTKVLGSASSGRKACVSARYRQGASTKTILEVVGSHSHKILCDVTNSYSHVDGEPSLNGFGIMQRPISHDPGLKSRIVAATLPSSFDDTGMVSEPKALLLGLLLGNGGMTIPHRVGFSCYEPDLAAEVGKYVETLGYRMTETTEVGEYKFVDDDSRFMKTGADGVKYRSRLQRWLKDVGVFGCGAAEKHIPDVVWSWDNASVAAMLAGLFTTDGCVQAGGGAAYSSVSLQLVESIRALLWVRFGVRCSSPSGYRKPKEDGDMHRTCYTITVAGSVSLARLAEAVPLYRRKRDLLIAAAGRDRKHRTSPDRATRASVTEVGECDTWDIHVDHPDHLFVLANGLVVSNSEPVQQALLGAKHKGGLAEEQTDELTGFALIDRLINTPKEFREAATHTEVDGKIEQITPATQGGSYVHVAGEQYYVPPNRKITAKVGDVVEAGDQLTDGSINPRMVVKHKGLGEGGRQLVTSLKKAIGNTAHRRNVELVVRGLVDRVRVTEEFDDYSPSDIVPYNEVASRWQPREGSRVEDIASLRGKYIEQPVLHYSVGTRITPSVRSMLQKHQIKQVTTHDAPPPFEPELVRATDLLRTDSDWMTRQIGTGLQKGLLESAHRGRISDEDSTSFVPARARAVDFGRVGKVQLKPPTSPADLPDLGHL